MTERPSFITNEIVCNTKLAMKKDQYFIIPDAYSEIFCDKIRKQIDSIHEGSGVELNYDATEMRIWSAQKRSPEINQFFIDSNDLITRVSGRHNQAGFVLAIRNTALKMYNKLNLKNRWHIDSWRSQVKVFLWLSNTTEESGPFEFIPNTHKLSFRLRKACEPGFFFDMKTIFKKNVNRPYQSISDEKIQLLFDQGYKTHPVLVSAGTVMVVNSSYLIHRARPCRRGSRYALTTYFDVPEN
jgi:ectoine hydroxylase-related dioxygenase (phytanoyl-CoA dioxygenase family)